MTYSEKLKDPRWQRKRLAVFELSSWRCDDCTDNEKTLHAHHKYYVKDKDPWDYPDSAFKTLCDECHDKTEEALMEIRELLGNYAWFEISLFAHQIRTAMASESPSVVLERLSYFIEKPLMPHALRDMSTCDCPS